MVQCGERFRLHRSGRWGQGYLRSRYRPDPFRRPYADGRSGGHGRLFSGPEGPRSPLDSGFFVMVISAAAVRVATRSRQPARSWQLVWIETIPPIGRSYSRSASASNRKSQQPRSPDVRASSMNYREKPFVDRRSTASSTRSADIMLDVDMIQPYSYLTVANGGGGDARSTECPDALLYVIGWINDDVREQSRPRLKQHCRAGNWPFRKRCLQQSAELG